MQKKHPACDSNSKCMNLYKYILFPPEFAGTKALIKNTKCSASEGKKEGTL
jgi:hypothetical protein